MAKVVDWVWDYESAGEILLRSAEITAICEEEAKKMTQATGVNYVFETKMGSKRVKVKAKSGKRWRKCPQCGKSHPNCNCPE